MFLSFSFHSASITLEPEFFMITQLHWYSNNLLDNWIQTFDACIFMNTIFFYPHISLQELKKKPTHMPSTKQTNKQTKKSNRTKAKEMKLQTVLSHELSSDTVAFDYMYLSWFNGRVTQFIPVFFFFFFFVHQVCQVEGQEGNREAEAKDGMGRWRFA